MPSAEVRWEITYRSLAALEESQAWKNWPAVDANGFTALYAHRPDGKMGYWGMVWNAGGCTESAPWPSPCWSVPCFRYSGTVSEPGIPSRPAGSTVAIGDEGSPGRRFRLRGY